MQKKEVTCSIARSVIQKMFCDWLATCRQPDLWFIEEFSTIYGVYIYDEVILVYFLSRYTFINKIILELVLNNVNIICLKFC